jgi:hypothetical protein
LALSRAGEKHVTEFRLISKLEGVRRNGNLVSDSRLIQRWRLCSNTKVEICGYVLHIFLAGCIWCWSSDPDFSCSDLLLVQINNHWLIDIGSPSYSRNLDIYLYLTETLLFIFMFWLNIENIPLFWCRTSNIAIYGCIQGGNIGCEPPCKLSTASPAILTFWRNIFSKPQLSFNVCILKLLKIPLHLESIGGKIPLFTILTV